MPRKPKTCDRCGGAGPLRVARASCPLAGDPVPPFRVLPPESPSSRTPQAGYALRLCGLCRAQWVAMTQAWWHDVCPDRGHVVDAVAVLVNGVSVEMTQDEAEEHQRYLEGVSG
jgi:hypothetical protein